MATTNTTNGIVLKQGVAYTRSFYFGTTGQTVTVNLSKNGAAFGAAAGAVSEISQGWYKVALSAVDTNTAGDLAYHCTAAAGGPAEFNDQVAAQIVTDILLDSSGRVKTLANLQTNAALTGFQFVMVDSTTGVPKTGLTVTSQRSLSGAGFSPCANSASEIGNGVYAINLAASDLNTPSVMLKFTATGAADLNILLVTTP